MKLEMEKAIIVSNLAIIGEDKKLNSGKAEGIVELSEEDNLEKNIEKAADILKVNVNTVKTLNFEELCKDEIKAALLLDSLITRTRNGQLKWYKIDEEIYDVVKHGKNTAVCDIPMIDVETGLFMSPTTGKVMEFYGEAVTTEVRSGFNIINLVYDMHTTEMVTADMLDNNCINPIAESVEKVKVVNEIVLWDKNKDAVYSIYYGTEDKENALENFVVSFSEYVRGEAEKTVLCFPVDVFVDDVLGL